MPQNRLPSSVFKRRDMLSLGVSGLLASQVDGDTETAFDGTCAEDSSFELRLCLEQLRNPYWYEEHGFSQEVETFWDRNHWERVLQQWKRDGYNGVVYWVEPWMEHGWQTFLIRHKEFPEANGIESGQLEKVIQHADWIFNTAKKFGLKNFLFSYFVSTTPSFAKAHGLDKEMPVSSSVDFRHNVKGMAHFGVRNDLTRAFTEASIAELFQTYIGLDGLIGGMGEALPGKRSTWYREALVPGLKRSGRNPLFIVMNWMLPLQDFKQDIAPLEVYDRTWTSVLANVEMFTDAKPYPFAIRWAEQSGVPTIMEIAHHNHEGGFPFNSPRLAYEIIHEYRKVDQCKGFFPWFLRYDGNDLFRKALGYYGQQAIEYSDEPWVSLLEERYGDSSAALHFLRAYDASARIPGEVSAIAWDPHDRGVSHLLLLPYWYWTGEDPRWNEFTSPARAGILLSVRQYARVVAKLGDMYRDNDGSNFAKNREHPGSQELSWGVGDYPITPESHMRNIQRLGNTCFSEAEEALRTVKKNTDAAVNLYKYMKAYKLLTDYYERKVLAAVSALIYSSARSLDNDFKTETEQLADEALECYTRAISFMWDAIDNRKGEIKGRWDGKLFNLPELIERERQERSNMASLFGWKQSVGG